MDGDHRGTVPLNVAVPGRTREFTLVALDEWEHATVLRGTAEIDRANPFWLPHRWGLVTDDGTRFVPAGMGATSLRWSADFEPGLIDAARELAVHIGPDGERGPEVSEEPSVIVGLDGWPATVRHAPATFDLAELPAATARVPYREGESGATSLVMAFPNPFGPGTVRTTVQL